MSGVRTSPPLPVTNTDASDMLQFSGHAVIPSLYRDMKGEFREDFHALNTDAQDLADPQHFNSMIDTAYFIACVISAVMGIIGYLMFVPVLSLSLSPRADGVGWTGSGTQ